MNNLGEYHAFYVNLDVLLLGDVFANFRSLCMNYYDLDAANFYTGPGLAWCAALKMTGVKLELMTDIDQHLMIEKGLFIYIIIYLYIYIFIYFVYSFIYDARWVFFIGLRGGISVISHRHGKANNRYVQGYDSIKKNKYLLYVDTNIL